MVPDPVGLAQVSPQLQTSWDWRAAGNFICGGTGTGLFVATILAGMMAPVFWPALFIALALVGTGLFCVWLEIGRPWRFLNVFRQPARSWMSREAIIALPFFALGGLAWLLHSPLLGILAALLALLFVYAQGRILRAAKGIPAWRQKEIVPVIIATGLTEGAGLFVVIAVLAGYSRLDLQLFGAALFVLVAARFVLWRQYRRALGAGGAPAATLSVLDRLNLGYSGASQTLLLALTLTSLVSPPLLIVAGLMAVATGWGFKFALVTKAAFNQGFSIERMPARGAGMSAPGIKPGWTAQ
ncbi:MAG: dimethyl sulfoxide reductase anchor subunit [Alphaproteobacteria bacterium]|nr:dimethyl sulfoxide reductase anchor subunit [Alphaproteobacteria bacterium]